MFPRVTHVLASIRTSLLVIARKYPMVWTDHNLSALHLVGWLISILSDLYLRRYKSLFQELIPPFQQGSFAVGNGMQWACKSKAATLGPAIHSNTRLPACDRMTCVQRRKKLFIYRISSFFLTAS